MDLHANSFVWNSTKLNMALVNLQSLKPKLDMLTHHTQLNNT